MSESKSPLASKINLASVAAATIGALAITGIIPVELESKLLKLTITLQPILIIVLRTWFTDKNLEWNAK